MAFALLIASIWDRSLLWPAVVALVGVGGVEVLWRIIWPHQQQVAMWGRYPGIGMLKLNLMRQFTVGEFGWRSNRWVYVVLITAPSFALLKFKRTAVNVYGLSLIVIWIAVTLLFACIWETSILLAPLVGGLIPAVREGRKVS